MSGYHRHTRHKEMPCGLCREAMRTYWKEQRVSRNKEINELRRLWRKRQWLLHNRSSGRTRARRLGAEYGYYTDQDVVDAYGINCHICNQEIDFTAARQCGKLGWEKGFHVDHVIPLSKGGADTLENVRPSHGQCNIIKWATMPVMSEKQEEVYEKK